MTSAIIAVIALILAGISFGSAVSRLIAFIALFKKWNHGSNDSDQNGRLDPAVRSRNRKS